MSRLAGVSIKTVSRVLNKERYVAPATREKIERVMAQVRFSPNPAARALSGGRSFQIALVCDNPSPFYVHDVQSGVQARCRADGFRMVAQPYDHERDDMLAEVIALIDQVKPDGLVLTPPISDRQAVIDSLNERRVPFVRISPAVPGDAGPSVGIDNEAAAFEIAGHLLALGHRRIALIAGHPDYAASGRRQAGYARALAAAGVTLDPELIRQGWFSFASGAAAADALLDLSEPPTAILASSDDMAAGALARAHARGLAVPEALSVAGFGDTALAQLVWPPLTSVSQPVRELGHLAVDLLLGGDTGHHVLPHRLAIRGSTGPAPR